MTPRLVSQGRDEGNISSPRKGKQSLPSVDFAYCIALRDQLHQEMAALLECIEDQHPIALGRERGEYLRTAVGQGSATQGPRRVGTPRVDALPDNTLVPHVSMHCQTCSRRRVGAPRVETLPDDASIGTRTSFKVPPHTEFVLYLLGVQGGCIDADDASIGAG
ncbi:hypothetical protein JB92DRAFT_2826430 [Gautieria morchelliformis]|nr:hypothetical protein JB92DRAFT_2834361 [Gautieria morchelliformis]KAF8526796.1 hypothetical protein JB92DRAFT_2826430 [Gautieria morchelliformis]